jgi:hypothetical protein
MGSGLERLGPRRVFYGASAGRLTAKRCAYMVKIEGSRVTETWTVQVWMPTKKGFGLTL